MKIVSVFLLPLLVGVFAQCPPSSDSNYESEQSVGNVAFAWNYVAGDSISVKVTVSQSVTGWVGAGFSETGAMSPSVVFIGDVTTGGVAEYTISGKAENQVVRNADQTSLEGGSIEFFAGRTLLRFTRKLTRSAAYVQANGITHFIFAYSDTRGLTNHGPNRGSATFKISDCIRKNTTTTTTTTKTNNFTPFAVTKPTPLIPVSFTIPILRPATTTTTKIPVPTFAPIASIPRPGVGPKTTTTANSANRVTAIARPNAEPVFPTPINPPVVAPAPNVSKADMTGKCAIINGKVWGSITSSGGARFDWNIEKNTLTLNVVFPKFFRSWVGAGFASRPQSMYPSTSFLGTVESGSVQEALVQDRLTIRSLPSNGLLTSGGVSVGSLNNLNVSVMSITRLVNTTDPNIKLTGPAHLIWAGGDSFPGHGPNRGFITTRLDLCVNYTEVERAPTRTPTTQSTHPVAHEPEPTQTLDLYSFFEELGLDW